MATQPGMRRMLKRHQFATVHACIPVVLSLRDLGAHMASCRRAGGATLTARIKSAARLAEDIAGLP
eukprot:7587692-Alexandrium_andersonii.AAC.1